MALVPLLSRTSVSADADNPEISYTNLTDGTVYGGANPARNTLAVYVAGYKVTIESTTTETALVMATFDPVTASTFTATNTLDGYQKYKFIIAPQYSNVSSYVLHDVVYYPTTSKWYKSKSATPLVGIAPTTTGSWDELMDPTSILENVGTDQASLNITYQILDIGLNYATDICLGDYAIRDAKTNCCGECQDPELRKKYKELHSISYLMSVYNTRSLFVKYEAAARDAQRYCNDCAC